TIAQILHSRVYLGEVRNGRHLNPRAHCAIVDLATWQDAQRPTMARANSTDSYLRGVLRCASCGLAMRSHSGVSTDNRTQTYQCPGYTSAGRCPAPSRVPAEELEPLLEEFAMRAARRSSPSHTASLIAKCESAVDDAIADVERYRDSPRLHETLGGDRYLSGLVKRQTTLEERAVRLAAVRRSSPPVDGVADKDLEAEWPQMTVTARRQVLGRFIECAYVEPGDSGVVDRVKICGPGDVPIDIPSPGRPIGRLRPFVPASTKTAKLKPTKRWATSRVEQE